MEATWERSSSAARTVSLWLRFTTTHADHSEPRADQGADFARRANRQLLKRFENAKTTCTFELGGCAMRPNKSLERTREG